jgi:hypothetical protein
VTTEYGPARSARERECRDDALSVLDRLAGLRLPESGWVAVGTLLERLDAALRDGDLDNAERAVIDLELRTEPRVGRIGDRSDEPPPPRTRDVVARLVHSLRVPVPGGSGNAPGSAPDGENAGVDAP